MTTVRTLACLMLLAYLPGCSTVVIQGTTLIGNSLAEAARYSPPPINTQ